MCATESADTSSPSSSSSAPASAAQSPPSAASWLTHVTSAVVSCWTAWQVGKTLPSLLQGEDWTRFGLACLSLVVIAAPTSVVPAIRAIVDRVTKEK